MGYQESYLHTTTTDVARNNEDIQKVLEIFKKYDIRCLGDDIATCYLKIHCKKNCGKFKKGMDVLFIAGDRTAQYHSVYAFNIFEPEDRNKFTEDELKVIYRVKISYYDNVMYMARYEKDKEATDVIELNLMPELPSNIEEVRKFADDLMTRITEYAGEQEGQDFNIYSYSVKTKEEFNKIEEIAEQTVKDHGFTFSRTTAEEKVHTGSVRTDYKYFMNGIQFMRISYIPWDDCYMLNLFSLNGKSLREIAKELLK